MLVPVYISFIGLAFVTGLLTFTKRTPRYVVIILFVMLSDLVLELIANAFLKQLHLKTNSGVYNMAMFVEFWFYPFYFRQVLKSKMIRQIINLYLFIYPVVWYILVFRVSGFETWNSNVFVTGTIVLIGLSACMYYQLFTSDKLIRLITNFEFVMASALIIFFASTYTLLGMLNYLTNANPELTIQLLNLLHIVNIIFYGMIAYAFICSFAAVKNNNRIQRNL